MLSRFEVKNFKSIDKAVVRLQSFTALVGPNSAGKSNFVDAFRFVFDSLTNSVAFAIQGRGGIKEVRRKSLGHPRNFGFRVVVQLPGFLGDYSFEVAAEEQGRFIVRHERCIVGLHGFEVVNGEFKRPVEGVRVRLEPDRLALPLASAVEEYRPLYDFLTKMRFYALVPDRIRDLQDPDPGDVLKPDGSNAAAVLRELSKHSPSRYQRLCGYLAQVVPGTTAVEYASAGPKETIKFRQEIGGHAPWSFDALNMSDGTLRALGVLLAVYQKTTPSLVVVEEPEATIHPGALEVLLRILLEASQSCQVLVTTHSPDLLDHKEISDDQVLVVTAEQGRTQIGPISTGSRELVKRKLYTPGALLRMGELDIDTTAADEQARQLSLFGATGQQ